MGQKGRAFVKGGCGCLIAFILIGLFSVLIGGSMQLNLGGAIALFVVGGLIGLIILIIYNKGAREGRVRSNHNDDNELR